MSIFNDRVRNLRKENNLSQEKLGKKIGVERHTISDWETGRTEPDNGMLKEIAEFFGVSVDYLLGRTTIRDYEAIIESSTNNDEVSFQYALYDEARALTTSQKEHLLNMAKFFKSQNENKK